MLVSWDWLKQYVALDASVDEVAERFALSGLNHESTTVVDGDPIIDLEVTSNRGDCLGHIGVAREAAVLWKKKLKLPSFEFLPSSLDIASTESVLKLRNEFTEGCPRYTARIIRGVKVQPSPAWLIRRLTSIGIKSVNNVVDVTNFVMFECGQPLHAFDLRKIRGGEIVVRRADEKEQFTAIDHRSYQLDREMVVISDSQGAIALGGVMGGENSEVQNDTVDLIIESADFTPLAIRRTARKLRLHSPASYRFERRVDREGLTRASDRCCQLILEVAGGKVSPDRLDTRESSSRSNDHRSDDHRSDVIVLRFDRVRAVLGIEIPRNRQAEILVALGCEIHASTNDNLTCRPPSYRSDLTREIDLIEELARIYGYDQIPEVAPVPIAVSSIRDKDILLDRIRYVTMAAGFFEALTPSVVNKQTSSMISPWTQEPPLMTQTQLLEGATYLRRSIVPSLIQSVLWNQAQQNRGTRLFETALIYSPGKNSGLPIQQQTLAFVRSSEDADGNDPAIGLRHMLGVLLEIVDRVSAGEARPERQDLADVAIESQTGSWLMVGERRLGWYGLLSKSIRQNLKLESDLACAEIDLDVLLSLFKRIPTLAKVIPFPAIQRELNFIIDESIRWQQLLEVITASAGPLLKNCRYCETYRDAKKDGPGKKRVLVSMSLQSEQSTLAGIAADQVVEQILTATRSKLQASIVGP